MRTHALLALGLALSTVAAAQDGPGVATAPPAPDGLVVREGFRVTTIIPRLSDARFMEFDDRTPPHLYVSRPGPGQIDTFTYENGTYQPLGVFVKDYKSVHGLHFKDGWLWFTRSGSVHRARDTDGDGVADEVVDVLKDLPQQGHWWRSIFVVDDGFFTSIGDSGNITDQTGTERQKIWKYSLDGSMRELWCSGIRNTEKLRYRPGTTELWGLDHGSDWFGQPIGDAQGNQPITDLNPPDEFNRYTSGGFYGHPFITGNRVPRYEFMGRPDIHELAAKTIPPEWPVPAHWATNGFCFVDPEINRRTRALPGDMEGDAIIACHGSWNRSARAGYCIARIRFDHDPRLGGHPVGLEKLVSCIDEKGKVRARPADVVQAPDGSILFSSDLNPGRVYRLTRDRTGQPLPAPAAPALAPPPPPKEPDAPAR
jgi:glucose/arabinose dehydrogenase